MTTSRSKSEQLVEEARMEIEAHQRRRALRAVAELAHQGGIGAVTPAEICRRARLTPTTFQGLFESRDGCLSLALIAARSKLFVPVRRAALIAPSWYRGMDAGLTAFFGQVAAEPLLSELFLLHGETTAGALSGCDAGREEMEALMAGGREAGRIAAGADHREPAPELEEFLARAVLFLATKRIGDGELEKLAADSASLVALAGSAFYGIEGTGERWRELRDA